MPLWSTEGFSYSSEHCEQQPQSPSHYTYEERAPLAREVLT